MSGTTTAWTKLKLLEQDVLEAVRHVEKLEREHRDASGRAERAKGPVLAYFEMVGAGERDADPVLERRLLDEAGAASEGIALRASRDRDGKVLSLEPVDERTEALLSGARRAVEKRRGLVAEYRRHAFGELAKELTVDARDAQARVQAAYDQLDSERDVYSAVRARWRQLMGGEGFAQVDLPVDPLREAGLGPVKVPLPVPMSLIGEKPEPSPAPVPPGPSPGAWVGENG